MKSKGYVRRTRRAVKGGLARLTGSKSDTATSDSDNATARRLSGLSRPSPQRKHGGLSRMAAIYPGCRKRTTMTPTGAERLGSLPQSGNTHTTSSKFERAQNGSGTLDSSPNNPICCFNSNHLLGVTTAQSQKHVTQQTQAANKKWSLRCPSCPRVFAGFESLRQHVATYHGGQGGSGSGKKTDKVVEKSM